jgi:ribosomal protein S18 acetylase RimI-like enzyme
MTAELTYSDDPRAVSVAQLAELRARCAFAPRSAEELRGQLDGSRWVAAAFAGGALVPPGLGAAPPSSLPWDKAGPEPRCGSPVLVGFARAISDGTTNAYISSVMVDAALRRRGVGRELLRRLMDGRPPVMRWVLHARADAIDFYRAIGFTPASDMFWAGRGAGT